MSLVDRAILDSQMGKLKQDAVTENSQGYSRTSNSLLVSGCSLHFKFNVFDTLSGKY